eukprot:COSAG06_NODE_288_length_18224_cov_8.849948_10_plen_136_part_00
MIAFSVKWHRKRRGVCRTGILAIIERLQPLASTDALAVDAELPLDIRGRGVGAPLGRIKDALRQRLALLALEVRQLNSGISQRFHHVVVIRAEERVAPKAPVGEPDNAGHLRLVQQLVAEALDRVAQQLVARAAP